MRVSIWRLGVSLTTQKTLLRHRLIFMESIRWQKCRRFSGRRARALWLSSCKKGKHYDEQVELVDSIAERIQLLGGVSLAMGADVAETTKIERPAPRS